MDRRPRAPAAAPGDPQSRVGRSSECGHLKWAHFSHYLHEFWLHLGSVFAVGWRCVVTNVGPTPESDLHVSVVGDVKVGQVVHDWSYFEDIRRDRRVESLSIRELAERHKVHRRAVRQALAPTGWRGRPVSVSAVSVSAVSGRSASAAS